MPSKNGVYYELYDSPYTVICNDCTFYFSSRKHKNSYLNKMHARMEWLNESLSKRFNFAIDARLIALFQLYFQVETRGCYVKLSDGKVLKCRENLELNGLEVSYRDLTQQSESTTMLLEEQPEQCPIMPLFSLD